VRGCYVRPQRAAGELLRSTSASRRRAATFNLSEPQASCYVRPQRAGGELLRSTSASRRRAATFDISEPEARFSQSQRAAGELRPSPCEPKAS